MELGPSLVEYTFAADSIAAMRVFGIGSDGGFTEYARLRFDVEHEESTLEKWLESNPDGILEDEGILIIGRQIRTDLGGFIDLVGVDREGNAVVVELKRDRTPRDVVAQALEYAAFAERLDADALESILRVYHSDDSLSLPDNHRECFGLDEAEGVAFNKDQRIVIIGQRVTPGIRRSAAFLASKGIRITCVEFSFFQADNGSRLLSQEIVVGKEREKPRRVVSGSLPVLTEEEFLASCDAPGVAFFSRLFDLAREESMPIHWGSKKFSLNVDVSGTHVHLGFGSPDGRIVISRRLLERKSAVPASELDTLWSEADASGGFLRGQYVQANLVSRAGIADAEMQAVLGWFSNAAEVIQAHGLTT